MTLVLCLILLIGLIVVFLIVWLRHVISDTRAAFREGVREGSRCRSSYIYNWAIRRERESRCSGRLNPSEQIFSAIIWGLANYCHDVAKVKPPSGGDGAPVYPLEQFSSDAGLFELSCYVYFRLDIWLYQNKPKLREILAVTLADQLISLFSRALEMDVSEVFDERTAKYGELVNTGAGLKEYHSYLSHLITRTEGGRLHTMNTVANEPLKLDAIGNYLVNSELLDFEKTMIPGLMKSLEGFCDWIENNMPSDSHVGSRAPRTVAATPE